MSSKSAVFIDVRNQYYCINKKWEGRKLNYAKYLSKATTFGGIVRSFAYGTRIDDTAQKFITALHHLGFEPQYKMVNTNEWYSWSVGIAMDIVRLVTNNKIDTVILGTADRSIVPVINWAKERGVRVVVIGCGICKDIKNSCDRWIEIQEDMLEDVKMLEDIETEIEEAETEIKEVETEDENTNTAE
jgi:uncharacterized LabA/DUF88 family protein